jgi:hypothetical protein
VIEDKNFNGNEDKSVKKKKNQRFDYGQNEMKEIHQREEIRGQGDLNGLQRKDEACLSEEHDQNTARELSLRQTTAQGKDGEAVCANERDFENNEHNGTSCPLAAQSTSCNHNDDKGEHITGYV